MDSTDERDVTMEERGGSDSGGAPALEVSSLRVETATGDPVVRDVSLRLGRGEALGLVGESGCGKTTTLLSVLGFTQAGLKITSGSVRIAGQEFAAGSKAAARDIRGRLVSYVPQNPGSALVPSLRVRGAVTEMLRAHGRPGVGSGAVAAVLERVGLSSDDEFQRRYSHQLSGGQQQRLCMAVALACDPPVVVLDEPTTGLDVITQARVLDELVRLRREDGVSMLYVTHDLAVVAGFADRIAVMYAGQIVEEGPTREVMNAPTHPYTRGLLASTPDHLAPRVLEPMPGVAAHVGELLHGCTFAPRCPVCLDECTSVAPSLVSLTRTHRARCLRATSIPPTLDRRSPAPPVPRRRGEPVLAVHGLRTEHRGRHEVVVAAHDVSLSVDAGQCVALVGESGSGKTTIARTISGAHPPAAGEIWLRSELLAGEARKRTRDQRRRLQFVFQNPTDALNPKQVVRTIIARPAQLLRGWSAAEANRDVDRLMELVRLPRRLADRYPAELSGGERQRVAIARALAPDPEIIICDEITSALDVSVQAAVLTLLAQLRDELGLGILLITHDFGVVAAIADYLLVLERGAVVEQGTVSDVLREPRSEYTKSLLDAAPSASEALRRLNGRAHDE